LQNFIHPLEIFLWNLAISRFKSEGDLPTSEREKGWWVA